MCEVGTVGKISAVEVNRLSNHPDFFPNPDQYAIGKGNIPISTRVVIFSSNSHKRKRKVCYEKTPQKLRSNYRRFFDRNCCVRTPEMDFPGGHAPRPPPLAKGSFGAQDGISQNLKPSGGWTGWVNLLHFILFECLKLRKYPGGGYLGQVLLGMCRWPLRAPTPL